MESSMESRNSHKAVRKKLIKTGSVITAFYVLFIIIYVILTWNAFLAQTPTDFATFLSGVFAPLAFFWLVLGFFQQGVELSHSSEALYLQQQELKSSVEQQKLLAEATIKQLDAQIEKNKSEEHEKYLNAQPIFVFSQVYGSDRHNLTPEYIYKLKNIGQPCTKLKINTDPEIFSENIELFTENDELRIEFSFSQSVKLTPILLTLSYRDARRMAQKNYYKLPVIEEDGYYYLGEPSDISHFIDNEIT